MSGVKVLNEPFVLGGTTPDFLLPSIREGPLQLTITFDSATTCGMHVLLFCQFPRLATITREGKTTLDSG